MVNIELESTIMFAGYAVIITVHAGIWTVLQEVLSLSPRGHLRAILTPVTAKIHDHRCWFSRLQFAWSKELVFW